MRNMPAIATIFCLGVFLAGCEPGEKIDENSGEFETWLLEQGMTPLDQSAAAELLNDRTLYGRYGAGDGRWAEYYSSTGVSVFQPDAEQDPKRRLVYFGTWWAETDRTCFSYPERQLYCYRVYHGNGSVYFIRIEDSSGGPAGSLVVAAEEVKSGNTEKYPFVGN